MKRNIREVGGKPRGGECLKREEEKVTVTREGQSGHRALDLMTGR